MQDNSVTPVSGADQNSSFQIPDHALIGKAAGIPISAAMSLPPENVSHSELL